MTPSEPNHAWPPLPLDAWDDTRATLQRWTQIVGKTRLALSPRENHWWHTALYMTARGLATSAMPAGGRALDIELDLLGHRLVARTSDGRATSFTLEPMSVAAFWDRYRSMLGELRVDARIWPYPVEVADATPFPDDHAHASYDPDAVHRFWQALLQMHRVLGSFRGRFLGKSSPVHFWWGSFDLACTLFSGREAPPHPGGVPNLSDAVTREAYSHECMSVGWWPGSLDGPVREPAFYAYAYPEPAGCVEAVIGPAAAGYDLEMREWILPYEAVRRSPHPDAMLAGFARSTYETVADLGGWDRESLER